MMRALLASPLGLLIGISLGALGGGGSILAVPALVYGAGQSARGATTTSLVLVGVTASIGVVPHLRAGRVRLAAGIAFGVAGVGGSLLGSYGNRAADADVLLLAFSVLMLLAAAAMWRRTRRAVPREHADATAGSPTGRASRVRLDVRTVAKVLAVGSVVGALTGFFGVGGGFVVVPALVLTLGFAMPEAVGTSLVVIAINSAVALAARIGSASIDWGTVAPFTIASLVGAVVGSRLIATRDPRAMQQWFVLLLVSVAVYTGVRSAIAL